MPTTDLAKINGLLLLGRYRLRVKRRWNLCAIACCKRTCCSPSSMAAASKDCRSY